jgi:quinoprotein glucose dehydrogenase
VDGTQRQSNSHWTERLKNLFTFGQKLTTIKKMYKKINSKIFITLMLTGWFTLLLGMVLGGGGLWLIILGGSWYYLCAGLAVAVTGILLIQRKSTALTVYSLVLGATLLWALWENGLDWWPLAARGDVLFVVGLFLLTPWITRGLIAGEEKTFSADRLGSKFLGTSLGAFLLVAVASWFVDPHAIEGTLSASTSPSVVSAKGATDWPAYGGNKLAQRYSPVDQINPSNVGNLTEAWTFRTGDVRGQTGDPVETTFEVTPLKIDNSLFICTPHQSVIALDATSGAQLWRHDPKIEGALALQHLTCRGLSYHAAVETPAAITSSKAGSCAAKLFMPTADGRILALNPETGKLCTDFGAGKGQIDLWANMPFVNPGSYYSTSPAVVTRKLLIVGGTVLDNVSTTEPSGVIRAFDVNTGALVWNWDAGNPEATAPIAAGASYTPNSPNSWSISSVDEELGLIYVPIGNQPPDQWGGNRTAAVERFSSSVVALDLATGKVRWNFQTVHHDLWDYDVPSQPSLVDLTIDGKTVSALVQPTKQGELFVLDRRNGKPVLPVTEVAAPKGAAKGDFTAATQPRSQLSFDPPALKEKNMWGATMFDQLACRISFRQLRYEGRYTPPSTQGTLVYPGNFGVFNWGSIAVDPQRQIAFVTPTYLAFVSTLIPRADTTTQYVQGGTPPEGALPALNENFGAPFAVKMHPFISPIGLPCQAPPWGYVAAADLLTGKVIWQHKNGTVRDVSPLPLPFKMGVPNIGGPIVTGGGVAFLSGTIDNYVRAYDVSNGAQLWESRLPAGGQATPMTYRGDDGRQYVIVAAGGHGSLGTKTGDYLIAYALPK